MFAWPAFFCTQRVSLMHINSLVEVGFSFLLLTSLLGCNSNRAEDAQKKNDHKNLVECRWASGKIKIDGKTDEVAWEKAQIIDSFQVYWQNRKPRTSTKARLLWDDDYLYFTADMEDTDLYADVTERNGMIWSNDVFELFFKPS